MDLHKIIDAFTKRSEIAKYSRMVSLTEIEKNEFNLNIPRYIDSQQIEDLQDIEAHLKGGIPSSDIDRLQAYWDICPALRQALFAPHRTDYLSLLVDKHVIKASIYEHPEFAGFIARMNAHFDAWQSSSITLKALTQACPPKDIIADLSENLLKHYIGQPLISAYDVYQHLMDYWAATMQDDCYLISADGWTATTSRVMETNAKGKVVDKGWVCELIPKSLVVSRYFAAEQAAIHQMEAELEQVTAQTTELEEEHGGDEGAYSELDKINKAAVSARLKDIKGDKNVDDEAAALNAWLTLNTKETALKKTIKDATAALDKAAHDQYPKLSEAEIKTLVINEKWLTALSAAIHTEMERISQTLTQRVKALAERYESPLAELTAQVDVNSAKVEAHLRAMGFAV